MSKKDDVYAEIESCLGEAIDLMEDIIKGEYVPDSFTTQPWRKALNNLTEVLNNERTYTIRHTK